MLVLLLELWASNVNESLEKRPLLTNESELIRELESLQTNDSKEQFAHESDTASKEYVDSLNYEKSGSEELELLARVIFSF